MKNIAIFFALLFLSNCKENCVPIPPLGQGVTSERKVLIEEFTGVRCPNCPQGSAEIANLLGIYKENLVAVSLHASEFDEPLAESKQDFRTTEGTSLLNFLGAPLGYPSAVVDRRKFPNASSLQAFKSQWAGFIQQELARTPVLAINLETAYNATTRQLDANVVVLPNQNLTGEHRLSVMITESEIEDAQDVAGVLKENYIHEHVLRGMLTNFDGNILTENLTSGNPVERHFTFTLPQKWVAENCRVIALVHHGGSSDKEVLQVEEKAVKN